MCIGKEGIQKEPPENMSKRLTAQTVNQELAFSNHSTQIDFMLCRQDRWLQHHLWARNISRDAEEMSIS